MGVAAALLMSHKGNGRGDDDDDGGRGGGGGGGGGDDEREIAWFELCPIGRSLVGILYKAIQTSGRFSSAHATTHALGRALWRAQLRWSLACVQLKRYKAMKEKNIFFEKILDS